MLDSIDKAQMFTKYDFSEPASSTIDKKSSIFGFLIKLIIFIIVSFFILYLGHQILLHLYPKKDKSKTHKKIADDLSEYIQEKIK